MIPVQVCASYNAGEDPVEARVALRSGAFEGLRDNVRALGEYAASNKSASEQEAKELVDRAFGALQDYDFELFQAIRNKEKVKESAGAKLQGAVNALDGLLATVPADDLSKAKEILEAIEMGGRPGQSQKAIDFERLQKLVPELGPYMASVDGEDRIAQMKPRPVLLQIFETTVFAVKKPVKVLLSIVAGVFSLRFLAAFLQICLEVHAEHEHIAPGWLVEGLGLVMAGLDHVGLVVLECTEVALIIFGVWVMLRMKEHMVSKVLVQRVQGDASNTVQQAAFEQVLLPLSGMGSWMLVVSGALMSMHVLGINLTPLLTVGGISGIVVGLSAQALLGNMISGLNLYLSRPFVVGDRIDVVTSSGGKVVSGFVEEVSPMRTHLRTDHWLSVLIPNKTLSDLIISNESRIMDSKNVRYYNKMRVFHFTACIRYQDFDKLEGILKEYREFLEDSDSIDMTLPLHANLAGFEEEGLKIAVHVHSRPSASRHYSSFKQDMLLNLGKIVKAHGADFAWKDHVEFTSGVLPGPARGNGVEAVDIASLAAAS
ncbi:hypothetical protein COCSUDRAFT_61447 [Coccomyxa subellipsoidea C-169]|uniref:Uncharacterized protein n=1 Tax=Coccomyxa subellipsoidea (strain C-169) TaxID=574566 RepID=I0Z3I9_COCSC|nr:hypothetical protein COCSUDRAFT_61447 [Coccomyxa subellipsoidea C-169]EIE25208.1 hypothetical protein COCSUDRAFT_61447 [Coccomyxa subellipsoidea C-169]|eukprot:XP_005649752.1 hypothetical protein COCSUDRAFT_61447 [Coccomyxa subellipsoidea C-169]